MLPPQQYQQQLSQLPPQQYQQQSSLLPPQREQSMEPKRGRGRPKGSKNKKKQSD